MPDTQMHERIAAWQQAGVIDAEAAARIEAFEASRPPAQRSSGRITVSEVIAYIGAIVLLVGVGFLYGTEYANLGTAGRLILIGIVAVAAFAAGELVRRTGAGAAAAARRARAAGWSVGVVAATTWLAQAFVDAGFLTRRPQFDFEGAAPDASGSLMVAALLGGIIGAFLLWRSGAVLLALVTAAALYAASGNLDAYLRIDKPGWDAELPWLGSAALLLALSETVTRGHDRRWAREILRFLVVLPPLIVALIVSAGGDRTDFEFVAGLLGAAGFGLALWRGSAGYAIAGGVGLFILVNEVGFRHFSNTLGFPVVLIISGVALFVIAAGMVRLLRKVRPPTPEAADNPPTILDGG